MKRILLGLFTISAVSMAADINPTNIYLKTGIDLTSNVSTVKNDMLGSDMNKKKTKNYKGEVMLEGTQTIFSNVEVGLGVASQRHGDLQTTDRYNGYFLPKLESIPVYLIGKYNIPVESGFKPYVFANLGYSFNDGKTSFTRTFAPGIYNRYNTEYKNGMYWAIGAGFELENFLLDLSYKVNYGKLSYDFELVNNGKKSSYSGNEKLNYGRVTLGFGYKFSF